MKTTVPFKQILMKTVLSVLTVALSVLANAQNNQGLVFKNPTLDSGNALKAKSVYLFKSVATGTNARVKVDSLVNGAKLKKIDDNSGGLGYLNAFQPEIEIADHTLKSYVVFTVTFYDSATNNIKPLTDVQATALDIDGNLTLKEFVELGMNGGTASYRTGTLDISVLQLLLNNLSSFSAQNILGIERTDIDTSALGNMFTVTRGITSSFTIRAGATNLLGSGDDRQFSVFMKGFNYVNTTTLPVKLVSFTATLNNNKAYIKWSSIAEVNLSHFVVEKSTDGINYSDAGLVFAYGSTTETTKYSFSDNLANSNDKVIYYRLRLVDKDGRVEYSATRIVRLSKEVSSMITIQAYPNPVTDEVRVTIPAEWQNKKVVYELFNANGVIAKKMETAGSTQTETLDMSKLARGLYIVRVSCDGETGQQKIIKQ